MLLSLVSHRHPTPRLRPKLSGLPPPLASRSVPSVSPDVNSATRSLGRGAEHLQASCRRAARSRRRTKRSNSVAAAARFPAAGLSPHFLLLFLLFLRPLLTRVPLSPPAKSSAVAHCTSCWERRGREKGLRKRSNRLSFSGKEHRATGGDALGRRPLFASALLTPFSLFFDLLKHATTPSSPRSPNRNAIDDRLDSNSTSDIATNRPARRLSRRRRRRSASRTSSESRTGSSPSPCRRRWSRSRSWRSPRGRCRCTRSRGRTLESLSEERDLVSVFFVTC